MAALQAEQIAPTVQHLPTPNISALRCLAYREGRKRPQKMLKMTHQQVTNDEIIPYPQSEAGKVKHPQPQQATAVKQDDDQGARGTMTNAETMMCAKSCPAQVGTYQG